MSENQLPPIQDYELKAGDTWARAWSLTNDDGTPLDLTGASLEFSAANKIAGGEELFSHVDAPGVAWIDENTSTAQVRLDRPATRELEGKEPVFEVTITFNDGRVRTLRDGRFRVRPEVVVEGNP